MNDELQQALAEMVKGLTAAAETVGQVGQEQIPLVVQEYLRWGMVDAVGGMLIFGTVFIWLTTLVRRAVREDWREEGGIIATMMMIPTTIIGFFVMVNFAAALKVLIAPRVYMIEQAANLLGGGK